MKLKGVGFFEQHIEKLVLGAVSVVFLGVVAMQFLHEPNTIKVGSGQPVAPGQAFEPVLRRAVDIQAKLNTSAEVLGLPEVPSIDLVDDFNRRRTSPVAPSPRIASFGKGSDVQGIVDTKIVGPSGQRLTALELPAPTTPVAAAYRNTIDPTEPHFNADLAKLLPPTQPFDKASVSVEASFDGTALRAALLSSGDGAAYPAGWWRDLMEIVGISLERQELQSSGEWSTAKPIPAPPGKGVSDVLQNVRGAADIPDLVLEVRSASESILRPTYYRVIAGPAWKPPSEAAKGGEVGRTTEIRRLAESHQRLMREQDNIKRRLEAAGAPPTRTPTSGGGGGGGGGKGGGGGGGGGGGQSPSADPDREQRERDARQRPIREQLKRNEEQVAKVEADLKMLGVDPQGNPLPQEPAAMVQTTVKPLLDDSGVRVWAHDLTAEGGKTYRYRVSLQLINPAFGRGASMVAEQQDLAKSPVVTTKPSEWSSPVYVLDDRYFHFSSATEADIQGPARARAELYQFFYGYYRPVSVYLEAGDVLAGSVKLPDPAKLPIYDMKALAAADPVQPAQPDPARAPAMPGRLQPTPPGRGLNVNEGDGGGRQAAQNQPEQGKVELPANAKPWEGPVRVSFETYLLDVARVPGGGAAGKSQVFLRGHDGTLAIRGTIEDEKSDVQRLIAASAKDGESQGQPVIPVVERQVEPQPQQPGTGRPDSRPPPGGGGGGGG